MKFDDIKKLHQKKYRSEFGYFLVEGEHLVLELQKAALTNTLLRNSELYITSAYAHWQTPFDTHLLSDRQMAQIAETQTPPGIIALVPAFNNATLSPADSGAAVNDRQRAVYLHEIQDPGNLGTIFRTLAWFGNFRCLLSPGSVDPYNSKVLRASMGAIFHLPIELHVDLDSLRARFARIACLDMHGDALPAVGFKDYDCYLFGSEARGIPRDQLVALKAKSFTIAGGDTIESLNLAAVVNMCAYELNR